MIAVIDYDTGNLGSVTDALQRLGADFVVSADHGVIRRATHVLLPGVGEASSAMEKMRVRGLDRLVPSLTQPVLGICIGMQLMCVSSEEGDARCMGIFPAAVRRLEAVDGIKIPHMGWDTVNVATATPLLAGIPDGSYLYYVHSFAADICASTAAITTYGVPFSALLARDNFYGVQFHPEKSGVTGARILENFITL